MLVHRLTDLAFRYFRPRRLRFFYRTFGVTEATRIVDLGGTPYFWNLAAGLGLPPAQVTIVNLFGPPPSLPAGVRWVTADATRLPFRDNAFDIVFCNSLIEHLHNSEAQQRLASEIRRVAGCYFVQTPSRRFPFEQHLWAVGVHWAPRRWQPALMRWTSLAGLTARFDRQKCEAFSQELCLLNAAELAALFPEASLRVEHFLGLEKSLLALVDRSPVLETGQGVDSVRISA
jgi:predicted SAM-dependent methyltransferase